LINSSSLSAIACTSACVGGSLTAMPSVLRAADLISRRGDHLDSQEAGGRSADEEVVAHLERRRWTQRCRLAVEQRTGT
jgi:hypothetical protein